MNVSSIGEEPKKSDFNFLCKFQGFQSCSLTSFTLLYRTEKIQKLCSVLGAKWINTNSNFDPDRAYELTMDNVKKIMAIQMRFR